MHHMTDNHKEALQGVGTVGKHRTKRTSIEDLGNGMFTFFHNLNVESDF